MKEFRLTDNNMHEYYIKGDEYKKIDNIIYLFTKDVVTTMINFNNILMIEELEPYEEIL